MINSLLDAVTKQLGTTFGNKYHYYTEDVEQALKKPCFTVDVLIPIQRSKSPVLYDRTMPLVLHYFSDSTENKKSDCYSMGERVVEAIEYLPFNNTIIRGDDISWHIVDNVLEIFVTYRFTTKLVVSEDGVFYELATTVAHKN